jgi:hypothetical protein
MSKTNKELLLAKRVLRLFSKIQREINQLNIAKMTKSVKSREQIAHEQQTQQRRKLQEAQRPKPDHSRALRERPNTKSNY